MRGAVREWILVAVAVLLVTLGLASSATAAEPLVAQWSLDAHQTSGGNDSTPDVSGNNLSLTSPAGTMQMGTAGGKFGGYLSSANTTVLQTTLVAARAGAADAAGLGQAERRPRQAALHRRPRRRRPATAAAPPTRSTPATPGSPGLHFYIRSGNQNILTDVPSTATVFDGNWHLIAGTYDGTAIRLFVDGVQIGTAKPAGAINYSLPDSSFYVDGYPVAACGSARLPGPHRRGPRVRPGPHGHRVGASRRRCRVPHRPTSFPTPDRRPRPQRAARAPRRRPRFRRRPPRRPRRPPPPRRPSPRSGRSPARSRRRARRFSTPRRARARPP